MRTLYLDCCMGAAGDMLTAALLDLLSDAEQKEFLREINAALDGRAVVSAAPDVKCGIQGLHVSVKIGGTEEEFPISVSLKGGQWKASKDGLDLTFGNYRLSYADGKFHLTGSFDRGELDLDVPANLWKPGSGNVYFGNSGDNVFKYGVLSYHETATGKITLDGESHDVNLQAYGNHYVTTLAVYDMFDEVADFRYRDDHLLVEFRYYVPSQKYAADSFGFMFVAYDGVPVLSSTTLERTSLEKWLDDENYGYEIDSRQRLVGREDNNQARFEVLTANPETSDPYADLPAFQRNVASRFAKPIEYSIRMQWELWLDVDGIRAHIPAINGSYSVTRLR